MSRTISTTITPVQNEVLKVLIEQGHYLTKQEFLRKAIEEKIEKDYELLQNGE